MVLINVTDYLKQEHTSFLDRLKLHLMPDTYWACSIVEMEEAFRRSPPAKKMNGYNSAFIIMDNLDVRLANEPLNEEESLMMQGSPSGMTALSKFRIKDSTGERLAFWMKRSKYQERSGICIEPGRFHEVPVTYMQYTHNKSALESAPPGWLIIQSFSDGYSYRGKEIEAHPRKMPIVNFLDAATNAGY